MRAGRWWEWNDGGMGWNCQGGVGDERLLTHCHAQCYIN